MEYKRVVITEFGGREVLKTVTEKQLPIPKKGEVRIKILKCSANFTDVMIRKGKYPEVKEKPPFALGYDMVGIVEKVGDGSHLFKVGDKVADMTVIGAYAEYICLPEDRLVKVPKNLDNSEVTTLILSYMTAYQMLHRVCKIREGQSILVHAGAGAVGIALLQLGKRSNLTMYATASKAKHHVVLKNNGIPIDYKTEDFVQRIKEISNQGVDAVFDPIGGENFKKSFQCLKPGGRLVAFGFYNAVMGKGGNMTLEFMKVVFWNLLPNNRKTSFYIIGFMRKKNPNWFKKDLMKLFSMLDKKEIQPQIALHLPLEDAARAHKLLENAVLSGKIIFDIAD